MLPAERARPPRTSNPLQPCPNPLFFACSPCSPCSVGPSGLIICPLIPGAARFALAPGYLLPRLRRSTRVPRLRRSPLATFYRASGARPVFRAFGARPWLPSAAPSALSRANFLVTVLAARLIDGGNTLPLPCDTSRAPRLRRADGGSCGRSVGPTFCLIRVRVVAKVRRLRL